MIQLINPSESNLNVDNANIQIDPANAGVQKSWRGNRNDDQVLPEGAYYIHIVNTDPGGGTITVNGRELTYGGEYSGQVFENRVTNVQDFVEETTIVANGTAYWLRVGYPSSSDFNPQSLD